MPLVRIDLPATAPAHHVTTVADAVHQALVDTFNVPAADRFQVVSRRGPDEIICTPEFLGVTHSLNVVFVQITCAPGRTVEQKKALFAKVATGISSHGHFSANDVIVNLVESARENWSFGLGLAQFA